MTSSTMTHSGAAIPSFFARKNVSRPNLSLRDWLNVASSALAMADSVPNTGRISGKQVAKVRALAETI